jgi:hypothetical protein
MRRLIGITVGLVTLAGCEGIVTEAPVGRPGTSRGPVTCEEVQATPQAIARLTRVEYDYAIEDLVGDTTRPASRFAADDVTTGFEVGGAVSPLLAEQYLDAATGIAERATADLPALCDASLVGEDCARHLIEEKGRLAYRRTLSADEVDALLALYRRGVTLEDHRTGVQLVLEALLTSPSFLYHVEVTSPDAAGELVALNDFELASRLSFFLWRSIPDDALLDAAAAGELSDVANVEEQARRMMDDPRALRGIHDFYRQWLDLDRLDLAERDAALYPEFSRELADDMRASLVMYVDEVMQNGGTLQALLRGEHAYVNERLAPLFGLEGITGMELRRVEVDGTRRSGILTHPALMTLYGKSNQSDPIHRGIFVRTRLLCQQLPPPPGDVEIVPPDLEPGLTTRERFDQHRDDPTCARCHQLIDPIGYGFEHYDALGRYRETEEGSPIDATGELILAGDATGPFDGAVELGAQLAGSDTVRECVARQFFRFAAGRIETDQDSCSLEALNQRFADSGYDLRELMVAVTTTDAFIHRRLPTDGAVSP